MNYVCVKQHDITDCGAACLATIRKQNGFRNINTGISIKNWNDINKNNVNKIIKELQKRV